MSNEEKKHKRRVHYSGKYPKKFEEKYNVDATEELLEVLRHRFGKERVALIYKRI